MVDIDPLYELVQLITDFLPVLIIIAVILFFIGLIFMLIPSKGKLASKLRIDKRMVYPLVFLMFLLMLSIGPGHGAPEAATAPGISYDASSVFGGTMMTVELTGLTVSTEYTVYASSNTATFNNVTLVASSATEFVPVPVLDETDGYYLNLAVTTSGVAAAGTASVWVAPRAIDDFLPTEFFFAAMVPIILIIIIVGIAVAFRGGVGGRGRS